MRKLIGVQVSQGIAVAPINVFYDYRKKIIQSSIEKEEVGKEYERFLKAVKESKKELEDLYESNNNQNEQGKITKEIIDVYIMLLEDEEFHEKVRRRIAHTYSNAEWAVKKVIHNYSAILEQSEDKYLAERIHDLNEIGIRVINYLSGIHHNPKTFVEDCIVVAHNLYPTELLKLPLAKIMGIVLEEGGITSHTAIIVKAYGIPMITGIHEVVSLVSDGEMGILDTENSALLVDIEETLIDQYKQKQSDYKKEVDILFETVKSTKHNTPLGEHLTFELNLDIVEELNTPVVEYADGIGLFRSEFILEAIPEHHDSEEKQFQIYKNLLERIPDKEVTIRTFDAGGDKVALSVNQINEENPLLGYRGIRFCLGDKEFFLYQLKALLRASCFGKLRILIPMVSSVYEMQKVSAIIKRAKKVLINEDKPFRDDVPIGTMIEVPSILYVLPEIAEYSDFFSIGTNDLLQYTMAADRGNVYVRSLYNYYQPAFLRILRDIFYQAHALKKDISLCGEMASFQATIPLLLGAGLRRFSVSPSQLITTISTATSYKISDARELFEKALKCSVSKEVKILIEEFNREHSSDNRKT